MRIIKKYFIYFVLIAPVLAKVIEWLFQIAGGIVPNKLSIFIGQIFFIEAISILIYLTMFYLLKFKKQQKFYPLIVGIAYFIKELFNALFVFSSFGFGSLIALTLEPVFMYVIIGLLIPRFIFKWVNLSII